MEKVKRYTSKELKDFNNNNISRLSDRELSRAVSDLTAVAKKRMNRLTGKGYTNAPALFNLNEVGGFKSIKGMSREELIEQFHKIRNFINNSSSSIKGINAYKKNVEKLNGLMTNEEFNKYLNLINKVQNINPNLAYEYTSTVTDLVEIIKNGVDNPNEAADILSNLNEKRYEVSNFNEDDFFIL